MSTQPLGTQSDLSIPSTINPMGTRGFEFVEFTGPDVTQLAAVMRGLGFGAIAKHRSKNVTLYRQGGINFILNGEGKGFPKQFSDSHGPSVCAIAIRVDDAPKAVERAKGLGAKALVNEPGPMEVMLPGIEGIGGSRIFFIDRFDEAGSIYDIDFKPLPGVEQHPHGVGLVEIDHLTNNVYRGRMDHWAGFYERLFNFREIRYFDIEGKLTGLKSRAMTSPDGKIRIPINESSDDKSQIEEYLREYKGEGIQHIALSTNDIYETVRRLRANQVELMAPPPATYYEMLNERLPGHGEDVAKLKELGLLLDGSPNGGLLLQIFTQTMVGPIFFEIIQRKGDEGFGEGNFRALFESIERDQVKRGVLKDDAKELGGMSRIEKKSSEPSFTVATTDHDLRGDYSQAAADFTIAQDWRAYTDAEHALWRKLYQRQIALMPRYAAQPVRDALADLDFGAGVPDLDQVSAKLLRATGWRLVAVPGFIPDTAFFAHLARRQFPVTIWLRKPEEIDYLVEPDIFHDFFGHVPLLFDPVFADFLQLYGEKGAEAARLGTTQYLARLYWYTVEFGLIREADGLKTFGAGILSSFAETPFSIDDASPNRIGFDLERVMRTAYRIDDFQQSYFVLESFADLFRALQQDLRPLYARVRALPDFAPDAVLPGERVFTRGTGAWARRT